MLEPGGRVLLLEALRPPSGYHFDEGIGTTYTLDLVALLTAPLAFTWFDQKDEAGPAGSVDSLEILESLRRYADRITVFCHATRMAVPKAHYPQLAFLEDSIVQCQPKSGGAFHPKVWVLRFRADEGEDVLYRMLCLSRNLTFSRAWDTMLALDGVPKNRTVAQSRPLADFLRGLKDHVARPPISGPAAARIEMLASEVERVEFEPPTSDSTFTFHPIGLEGRKGDPLKALRGTRRLLVVSPFLAATQLSELSKGRTEMWVVSTASQLEGLSRKPHANIHYHTLKERLLAEVEDGDQPTDSTSEAAELSDLHAKLYVTEVGAEAHVWTGSANATVAAFDKNVEFMVEVVGPRKRFGIDSMMQPEKSGMRFINLLEGADELVATTPVSDELKAIEQRIDGVRSQLAVAGLSLNVSDAGDGAFDLTVTTESDLPIPDDVKAACWPAAISAAGTMFQSVAAGQSVAAFPSVPLRAITAFLAFKLSGTAGGEKCEVEFVLAVPLIGAPAGRREQILRSLVKDRSRMLRFLWLLLADDVADMPSAPGKRDRESRDQVSSNAWSFPVGGLFEVLLRNLDRSPERLDYLNGLITELRQNDKEPDLLPPGFDAIWEPIWNERVRQKATAR